MTLVQHDTDLWSCEYTLAWQGGLVPIPVRMTVIRLGDGRLILYLNRGGSWQSSVLGTVSLHNIRCGDIGGDGDVDVFGVAPFGVNPVLLYERS